MYMMKELIKCLLQYPPNQNYPQLMTRVDANLFKTRTATTIELLPPIILFFDFFFYVRMTHDTSSKTYATQLTH